jgi:hypothetical protein
MLTVLPTISETAKPPHPKRWIPVALKGFVALLALLAGVRVLIPAWNKSTVDRFLRHAHDGDFAACRTMLAEDPYADGLLLDEHWLKMAADERLSTEPMSIVDFVRGRQRFSVHLAAFNDHSITVEWGSIRLGSAFWYYIPAGPSRITKTNASASAVEAASTELSEPGLDENPFGGSNEKPFGDLSE